MSKGLHIQPCQRVFENGLVVEGWMRVHNQWAEPVTIGTIDSMVLQLPKDEYEILYYSSAWGSEFQPIREPVTETKVIRNGTGRSSHGKHPWFALFGSNGQIITGSIMWSGNWAIHLEPNTEALCVRIGLDASMFHKTLAPGGLMESPHVVIAYGNSGDLNETTTRLHRVMRAHWTPKDGTTDRLLVEWNHWWVYEDVAIDEDIFRRNVDAAAELGIELCTLDAGWFGASDSHISWFDVRGDWHLVNKQRFPSGIRALSDYVHARGMKFGLWCEIEALGSQAELAQNHPDFPALQDGEPLGYVCFGNPAVREWAFAVLDTLITNYQCDWIKLDFNLDPMAGCNRIDHGHGLGDGLYEHYVGYYEVLDNIRLKHPNVILENCASGGLRIDLGMLQHTHTTFLSDCDWPEHNLQVFWGATTMLPPDLCLHWANSEWYGEHPKQTFHPDDQTVQDYELDFYVHSAMLGGLGFSQRLPDLPDWIRHRYRVHIDTYQKLVRRFVRQAALYRLTDQPRRDGLGSDWAAFQYNLGRAANTDSHLSSTTEDAGDECLASDEHLLFVFRLPGATATRRIFLQNLSQDAAYRLVWVPASGINDMGKARMESFSGRQLVDEGILFDELREMESALIYCVRADSTLAQ